MSEPNKLPKSWLSCPKQSNNTIADTFVAFKIPLSSNFDTSVPEELRFNMQNVLESVENSCNKKIGLIMDLSNSNGFYDPDSGVKQQNIKHVKILCKEHGDAPSKEIAQQFIQNVESFTQTNPSDLIGVHCTLGYNRTGFLICCYLIEKFGYTVDKAVALFAQVRPPGLYKQEFINELYKRYEPNSEVPIAPLLPNWETEFK
ncbi:unnamed protein product [Brachionus calyciflorus]|uniref:Tyrosine specific protein phosphatases domain-containing protein n=1 Tax=Brachionus calyciflorus TaxID=104777 RepID=A0A813ZVX4_9BILA|nr:unnamed protein product [Brachionus calyciflorus]